MVRFLNAVSWAGTYFCYAPGQVIEIEEATAIAREKLNLGKVVVDRTIEKPVAVERPARKKLPVAATSHGDAP